MPSTTIAGAHCNIRLRLAGPDIMTTVESLHHVGIAVTDPVRSRHFYTTVLCLEEIPRPDFYFDGAWFRVGEQHIDLDVQRRTAMPREDGLRTAAITSRCASAAIAVTLSIRDCSACRSRGGRTTRHRGRR